MLLAQRTADLFCVFRQNDSSVERVERTTGVRAAGTQQRSQFGQLRQTGPVHTLGQLRQLGQTVGRTHFPTVTAY